MLEETEYAFLRKCGLSVVLTDEKGLMGFPRLSTNVTMQTPLFFDDVVTVEIRLLEVDGKMVEYDFSVWRNDNNEAVTANDDESDLVGTGNFKVAVCRFPGDQLPYAVLTPQYVMDALTKNLN